MIPEAVAKRWGPMWDQGADRLRPWWCRPGLNLRRVDGLCPVDAWELDHEGIDKRGLWDGKESYRDFMARIDREHPLPRPPAMPGQVWLRADGREHLVTGGDTTPDMLLGEFVALLAGPSPWGRDVPWRAP